MTQPIHLIGEVYAVEVPEGVPVGALSYIINSANGNGQGLFFKKDNHQSLPYVLLPPGNWEVIGTTKEVTEEQLTAIPDLQHHNFKEWFRNFEGRESYFYNRKASFRSLLTSKGMEPGKNYVIVKKVE